MANSYPTAPTNSVSSTAANSAAAGTYTLIGQYDLGAAPPHELFLDIGLTPSTSPGGNFQSTIFISTSLDGTTWSDAPSSTTEGNARQIGVIRHPDSALRRSVAMTISQYFSGALPRYVRVYTKNDCGVSYASTGNTITAATELFG